MKTLETSVRNQMGLKTVLILSTQLLLEQNAENFFVVDLIVSPSASSDDKWHLCVYFFFHLL